MTIVVHSTAAATVAAELMVPVQRFPIFRGFLASPSVGAARATESETRGRMAFEKNMMRLAGRRRGFSWGS